MASSESSNLAKAGLDNLQDPLIKVENKSSCCSSIANDRSRSASAGAPSLSSPTSSTTAAINNKKVKHEVITIQGVVNQHYVEVNKDGARILSEEEFRNEQANKVYSFISENPGKFDTTTNLNASVSFNSPTSYNGNKHSIDTKLNSLVPNALNSATPETGSKASSNNPQFVESTSSGTSSPFCCCGTDDCDCENCEGCKNVNDAELASGSGYNMWLQPQYQTPGDARASSLTETNTESVTPVPNVTSEPSMFVNSFVDDFKEDLTKEKPKDFLKQKPSCCSKNRSVSPRQVNQSSEPNRTDSLMMIQAQNQQGVSENAGFHNMNISNTNTNTSAPFQYNVNKPPNFILPMDVSIDDVMSSILSNPPNQSSSDNAAATATTPDSQSLDLPDLNDISDIVAFLEQKRDSLNEFIPSPPMEMSFAPSCVLPGQCQCGENCKCVGCSTHGNGNIMVSNLYTGNKAKPGLLVNSPGNMNNAKMTDKSNRGNLANSSAATGSVLDNSVMHNPMTLGNSNGLNVDINSIDYNGNVDDISNLATGLRSNENNNDFGFLSDKGKVHNGNKRDVLFEQTQSNHIPQTNQTPQVPQMNNDYRFHQMHHQDQFNHSNGDNNLFNSSYSNGLSNMINQLQFKHVQQQPFQFLKMDHTHFNGQPQHTHDFQQTQTVKFQESNGNPDQTVTNYLHSAISTLQSLLLHHEQQQQQIQHNQALNYPQSSSSDAFPAVANASNMASMNTSSSAAPANTVGGINSGINAASIANVAELLKNHPTQEKVGSCCGSNVASGCHSSNNSSSNLTSKNTNDNRFDIDTQNTNVNSIDSQSANHCGSNGSHMNSHSNSNDNSREYQHSAPLKKSCCSSKKSSSSNHQQNQSQQVMTSYQTNVMNNNHYHNRHNSINTINNVHAASNMHSVNGMNNTNNMNSAHNIQSPYHCNSLDLMPSTTSLANGYSDHNISNQQHLHNDHISSNNSDYSSPAGAVHLNEYLSS